MAGVCIILTRLVRASWQQNPPQSQKEEWSLLAQRPYCQCRAHHQKKPRNLHTLLQFRPLLSEKTRVNLCRERGITFFLASTCSRCFWKGVFFLLPIPCASDFSFVSSAWIDLSTEAGASLEASSPHGKGFEPDLFLLLSIVIRGDLRLPAERCSWKSQSVD